MSNRLTDANLKVLKSGGTYVVGSTDFWNSPVFGSNSRTDKVELHVYDLEDNLIKSDIISDFKIASSGNVILKPGDDLRTMGFISGEYKATYNFFRNLAGSNNIVLVETLPTNYGNVYSGPPSITGFGERPYWVNSDGIILKGFEGDSSTPEELDVRELKYFVQAISPSRTEIRLAPLDIKLESYKTEFASLYSDEKVYTPIYTDGNGRLSLQDSSTFDFTINSYTSNDSQINESMVGGILKINNAFIIGYDVTQTSLVIRDINMIEMEFDWSPTTALWDSTLHIDAVKPNQNWSYGYQGWVASPGIGYHPMWVEDEGKDGVIAIKFIDNNGMYGFPHRQLSVFNSPNDTLASKGITHGDLVKITWNQKSNADKYIRNRIKYHILLTELIPQDPPTGYIVFTDDPPPTEPPSGYVDWTEEYPDRLFPADNIPPNASEFNGTISDDGAFTWNQYPDDNGIVFYTWARNPKNFKSGTTTDDGQWIWEEEYEARPTIPPVGFDMDTNRMHGTRSYRQKWLWFTYTDNSGIWQAGWYRSDPYGGTPINENRKGVYEWHRPDVRITNAEFAGTKSPQSEWTWNIVDHDVSSDTDVYDWVQIDIGGITSIYFENQVENVIGEWEEKSAEIEIPTTWDLNESHTFVIDGVFGDEGIMWVSDVKIEYIYKDTIVSTPIYESFESKITQIVGNDILSTEKSWNELGLEIGHVGGEHETVGEYPYSNWTITYKIGDNKNLITLLNFDDNNLALTVNHKKDDVTAVQYPYSIVYKMYEPLNDNIKIGDLCWIVKEMLPSHSETISLIPFVEDKIDAIVLRPPLMSEVESPLKEGTINLQSRESLLTTNSIISTKLQNLVLSGSNDSIDLNVDYSRFENFAHFSSVKERINNFKTKITQIESYTAQSASLAVNNNPATSSLTSGIQVFESKIYSLESSMDKFEKYMYIESSSYVTSSLGQFFSNSWPKQTTSKPHTLFSVTASESTTWYDGTITSASMYDLTNSDRLVNLTPIHVVNNPENVDYLTFLNMVGHYFDDNIWLYAKAMTDVNKRTDSLDTGLSKDLVYTVAKSLGWEMYNGKSLVNLPKYKLGLNISGSTYETTSAVSEEDISKEIWNRIINNMPYFMKTKGTIRSLRGLINCYGIPSSILKVKEFGGPDKTGKAPSYEITNKFTKAIDFKGSQSVQTTWVADTNSGRKPDTVEFRFKSATGSNQTLANVGDNWGIYLKDNGSVDNYGSVAFALSGSGGYEIISSSAMPIYDGEFYSVMLKRSFLPSIISTVSSSVFAYNDTRVTLTSVSSFASSGQFTSTNTGTLPITFRYTSKNTYTNELIGITGWPKRIIRDGDNAVATSSISIGTNVQQLRQLTTEDNSQAIKYELVVKKYNASTSKINYSSVTGLTISASINPALSESYNAAYSSSGTMSVGGSTGNFFGNQFSGSMMEFRYWNSALNMEAFDNHVSAPKAFNGNHPSASYTDLVLRYSFDDDTNLNTTPTIRDTSADQSYIQAGTAVNFANEINFSSVEDEQKMFVPDVGPNRRIASKVRIEDNYIEPESDGNRLLSVNIRKENSSFDTAPIDSNVVGIYFAPTDVINEDIIMSVADLDFSQYIGDPRDRSKQTYPALKGIADSYWQKYSSPNSFWDYIRLIKYYDNSLFDQLDRLLPFRVSSRLGIMIEPNILERSKVVIIKDIDHDNHSYFDTIDVNNIIVSSGSESYHTGSITMDTINQSGSYDMYRGTVGFDSSSNNIFNGRVFQEPSLYILTGSYYATSSLQTGYPRYVFEEAWEPNITGSRLSDHIFNREYYYTSAYSESIDNYYSSSLVQASYNVFMSTPTENLFYKGCKQTKDTTPDGKLPVEITITSPTTLITKEPGESKLRVE